MSETTVVNTSEEQEVQTVNIESQTEVQKVKVEAQNEVQEVTSSTGFSPGAVGRSAYQVAIENGFIGTEDEWVASLGETPGPKGDQGIQGEKGDKGAKGDIGLTGPIGLTGDQGIQGIKGDIGPKGDKGDIGLTGPIGEKGFKGDQGIQGVQGEVGPQGLIGLTGPQGEQGTQGIKGDKGDVGLTGPMGLQGDQGIKGDTGSQGPVGLTGDVGPVGPVGLTGAKGDTGLTGDQGIQGVKGDKGDVGLTGPQGIKGDIGATGLTGDTGLTGPEGPIGPQGDQGIQGDIGLTGAQGDKGNTGDTGDTGPQGPIGLTGPSGPQGVKGDKGNQGDIGLTGATGPKGDTGLTGSTGAIGPKGDKGDKGDQGEQADVVNSLTSTSTTQALSANQGRVLQEGKASVSALSSVDLKVDGHIADDGNPHSINKTKVGLSGIPNVNGSTSNYLRGDGIWSTPPNTNTTYSAGTGISLSGTTFSLSGNSFNSSGSYSGLRAQSTTNGDVGLGNVRNTRQVARGGDTMTGNLYFSGGTRYIGTSDANDLYIRGHGTNRIRIQSSRIRLQAETRVHGHLYPNADDSRYLGSSSLRWNRIYARRYYGGTTSSRTSSSTTTLLRAAAMNNHRTSGDHDSRYVRSGASQTLTGVSYTFSAGNPNIYLYRNPTSGNKGMRLHFAHTNNTNGTGVLDCRGADFRIRAVNSSGNSTNIITIDDLWNAHQSSTKVNFHTSYVAMDSIITISNSSNVYIHPTSGRLYRSTSSIKYKEQVTNLSEKYDALNTINLLRPVWFVNKDEKSKHIGLIAEEVCDIIPELGELKDGKPDGVQYSHVTALLIQAIKDQQVQINQLKALIA